MKIDLHFSAIYSLKDPVRVKLLPTHLSPKIELLPSYRLLYRNKGVAFLGGGVAIIQVIGSIHPIK